MFSICWKIFCTLKMLWIFNFVIFSDFIEMLYFYVIFMLWPMIQIMTTCNIDNERNSFVFVIHHRNILYLRYRTFCIVTYVRVAFFIFFQPLKLVLLCELNINFMKTKLISWLRYICFVCFFIQARSISNIIVIAISSNLCCNEQQLTRVITGNFCHIYYSALCV